MLPAPSLADLKEFTGRDDYPPFAVTALKQSTLFFSLVTGLTEMPEDPDRRQLAVFAICQLADRLILEQPYAAAIASPYQSETIMSYSYSKGSTIATTATRARNGLPLGLFWWDLAIDELTVAGAGVIASGVISVQDEDILGTPPDQFILGPDQMTANVPPYVTISKDVAGR